MKRLTRCVHWGLSLLALAGCGGADPRCAVLPGGARYCLQATTAVAPFDVQQMVEASVNERRETMIFQLEVDADEMRLAGLTPFGQKLIALTYDNRAAKAGLLPDQRLPPALLLSLLQLALWPADSVRAGLDRAAQLSESDGQRRVMVDGQVVVGIDYGGRRPPYGEMRIVLPSMAMEFEIKTLDSDRTP